MRFIIRFYTLFIGLRAMAPIAHACFCSQNHGDRAYTCGITFGNAVLCGSYLNLRRHVQRADRSFRADENNRSRPNRN